MKGVSAVTGHGQVTVELDSGPFTMEFCYQPVGMHVYSDVPRRIGTFDTEGAAEMAGARMLAVGNWRSFTVEKRYQQVPSDTSTEAPS